MTKDEFQKTVDDVVTDCIRNDYSFGSYARKVTDAVWPVLEAAEEDAAHYKALAESFLRVAKGWEDKCNDLRAKIAEMENQGPARLVTPTAYRWRRRGSVMWQYGELTEETVQVAKEHNHEVQSLYALPGTQNVPKEAIGKILTEVMDIAVSNGADGRSMPDEYVEVAAWLCGIPTYTATSVPENYFGMTLHDKIEAMENKL